MSVEKTGKVGIDMTPENRCAVSAARRAVALAISSAARFIALGFAFFGFWFNRTPVCEYRAM